MLSSRVRIGSMGFSYSDWRGFFYLRSLDQGGWLKFYSSHFNAIELDTTFHAVPPPERVARWRDVVPEDFKFAVKTPRAITHDRQPADSRNWADMTDFVRVMSSLGEKWSRLLVQYPPSIRVDQRRAVFQFLERLQPMLLPLGVRPVVEFRHQSWFAETGLADALAVIGVTLVWAEYDRLPTPPVIAGTDVYLRLIGIHDRYKPLNFERYDPTPQLKWWLQQIERAGSAEPWVLVNNDYAGFSVATMNHLRTELSMEPVPLQPAEKVQLGLFQ